ncbi:MAG: GNAT family N-acetyltransferase [Acidobacteria bacterium]|nr:GNAT family N-acetyltransferase [Acidobacteriota bacterium]
MLTPEACDSIRRAVIAVPQPKQDALRPTTVRPYEAKDFEVIYRLDQLCYPPGIAYSRFGLRMFLAEPGARAWVAEEGGALPGFVLVRQVRSTRGHVITLDVRADRRRHGIGRALLDTAEVWLAAQGVRRVRLETAVDNQAALAFWQQAGYEVKGTLPGYYLDRDDAYRMEKELG